MEFPVEVWRLIKSYQIPYNDYWRGKLDASIDRFNAHHHDSLETSSAPNQRPWARVRFSTDPGQPEAVILMASIVHGIPTRYIVHRNAIIHYPIGIGGVCLPPSEILCITNYL